MHLFHKWKIISTQKVNVMVTLFGTHRQKEIMELRIERCDGCQKERGFVIDNENNSTKVNPFLWK